MAELPARAPEPLLCLPSPHHKYLPPTLARVINKLSWVVHLPFTGKYVNFELCLSAPDFRSSPDIFNLPELKSSVSIGGLLNTNRKALQKKNIPGPD